MLRNQWSAKQQLIQTNATLLNSIAPMGLDINPANIQLGDVQARGFAVIRYPDKIDYGWLSDVCNLSDTTTSITFTPALDGEAVLKVISRTISNNKGTAEGIDTNDAVAISRARKAVENGNRVIESIDGDGESVGNLSISALALSREREQTQKIVDKVKRKYGAKNFVLRPMNFYQQKIFESVLPFGGVDAGIADMTNQIIPMSTLWGGFPLASTGYNDGSGIYVGKDKNGGFVFVDLWKRGGDRTNSNLVCMGSTGAGKSTAIKHLMQSEYELGTKFVILDPQREYKDLCMQYDGDWFDTVGNEISRINPFHIYRSVLEDDEEQSTNWLALHISSLEVFFRLYLHLDGEMMAVLNECIEKTYLSKGIDWRTDVFNLSADAFPIMSDLYAAVQLRAMEYDKEIRDADPNYYRRLEKLLRSAAIGSDSFIFNGKSTINPTKSFIVMDTQKLQSLPDNVKSAIYYITLNFAENILTRDKTEQSILVADEAHFIIDKRVPDSLAKLSKIEKTARKYEGALWTISQQLVDFLSSEVKQYGQVLLELPNIKLLMGVGKGVDLRELKETYELTDAETELLNQQERGKGLLMIGKRRLSCTFMLPPHHLEQIGTAGGR